MRALGRPIAVCMLPVMIVTVVAVLQGYPVIPYVWFGSGVALLLASLWTTFRLQRDLAEIHVHQAFAAVRSVWDVSQQTRELRWYRVLDLRDYRTWSLATIGLTSYEINWDEWPEYEQLKEALREAMNMQ